jgi:hypothetical protein
MVINRVERKRMFPHLEAELERSGYSDEYVARKLGITMREYDLRRTSDAFRLSEALALSAICGKPIEHLFQPEVRRDGGGV